MSRRFRVTANFPILEQNAHQTVIVDGSNWQVALGKAAREFKKLPVMHRRRVTGLSMMVEQIGSGDQTAMPLIEQPADGYGSPGQPATEPASEETVMEGPLPTEAEIEEANDEAERLIMEGEEIEDLEE